VGDPICNAVHTAGFLAREPNCSFFPFSDLSCEARVLTPQGAAYPCDHAVPLALFRSRIIDQHAVHGAVRPVAAVVPDAVVANAGHDEEIRRHPLIDDAGRRAFLRQEYGGGIVVGIGHKLHRQIGTVIVGEKAPPYSAFRRAGIACEDRDRHLDASSRARDRITPPFCFARKSKAPDRQCARIKQSPVRVDNKSNR